MDGGSTERSHEWSAYNEAEPISPLRRGWLSKRREHFPTSMATAGGDVRWVDPLTSFGWAGSPQSRGGRALPHQIWLRLVMIGFGS